MSVLFMVGSLCFAVAAAPGLSGVLPSTVIAATFVVGSLFFTAGAAVQWRAARPRSRDWLAAAIQFAGTLWFNINTIAALGAGLTVHQQDLRVWTPDMIGSVCFLVSSALAMPGPHAERDPARTAARLNLAGSVFFMAAAIAAFVRPATGDATAAGVANAGTFLGALCFLLGARLLLPSVHTAFRGGDIGPGRTPGPEPRPPGSTAS
jgi:hypothetical protein